MPQVLQNMLLLVAVELPHLLLKQAAGAGCGVACLMDRSVSPSTVAITVVQVWASSVEKKSELHLRVSRLSREIPSIKR